MLRRILRMLPVLGLAASLMFTQTAASAQEATTSPNEDAGTIGGSGDNVAVAINTKDGSSRVKVSFRIVRTSADVVDNGNVAVAFASCESCRSVAIAVQLVLVGGSPSTVIPENYAIALNVECFDCESLASAYQFVLGTDGNVHFTPEGNRALAEIRNQIRELARSSMEIHEIQAQLDALANELRTVLRDELVAAGAPGVEVQEVEEGATPTPSPSVSSSPTAEPTPTPTPSQSETPEPSPSPSPEVSTTPSATPSPTPSASAGP